MCNANLLLHIESFDWDDLTLDRSNQMDDLDLVIEQALDDMIYGHPNCFNFLLSWGLFHELLVLDEEERRVFTGWLSHAHQITLINLWNRSITPKSSFTLDDLENEFQNSNNGMLGLDVPVQHNKQVFCKNSWIEFHRAYVKSNPELRRTNLEYFRKFYVPELRETPNQINALIRRQRVHQIFDRLDGPTQVNDEITLHAEQFHMHFRDNEQSALNIDGTWKHGGFNIPLEACQQLEEWGFLLPEE